MAITTPAKVAHNFPRSFFETTQKRCNSNDINSMFEQAAGELRAKLLWRGPLHPSRATTPVKGRCTRYGARHPIRRGALPTDRVQHTQSQEQTRKLRRHGPGCGARNTRGATQHHSHTAPPQPAPTTKRGRDRFPGHGLVTQSAPLTEAAAPPAIRRSCPRGPRPRRGQPRGGRRGRGTGSRTRSQHPRCGRSGSTAGRHRARHTRRA